jgi:membrane protein implicated in regulation of membrane protease activity
MVPALWWGLLAVALFTLEIATTSFFFLWIGAGAVITAVASFFVPSDVIQYILFGVSSVFLVAISRRWATKLSGKSSRLANVDSLIGQTGKVTKLLSNPPTHGYAMVEGQSWRVEAQGNASLTVGDEIRVKEVRSNLLIVEIINPTQ